MSKPMQPPEFFPVGPSATPPYPFYAYGAASGPVTILAKHNGGRVFFEVRAADPTMRDGGIIDAARSVPGSASGPRRRLR